MDEMGEIGGKCMQVLPVQLQMLLTTEHLFTGSAGGTGDCLQIYLIGQILILAINSDEQHL